MFWGKRLAQSGAGGYNKENFDEGVLYDDPLYPRTDRVHG